jgi:hypothetical protein
MVDVLIRQRYILQYWEKPFLTLEALEQEGASAEASAE